MPDIADIVRPETLASQHISSDNTIISSSSQRRYTGETVRELLQEAIPDILQHQLFHDGAFTSALQDIDDPQKVVLLLLGPGNAKISLQRRPFLSLE